MSTKAAPATASNDQLASLLAMSVKEQKESQAIQRKNLGYSEYQASSTKTHNAVLKLLLAFAVGIIAWLFFKVFTKYKTLISMVDKARQTPEGKKFPYSGLLIAFCLEVPFLADLAMNNGGTVLPDAVYLCVYSASYYPYFAGDPGRFLSDMYLSWFAGVPGQNQRYVSPADLICDAWACCCAVPGCQRKPCAPKSKSKLWFLGPVMGAVSSYAMAAILPGGEGVSMISRAFLPAGATAAAGIASHFADKGDDTCTVKPGTASAACGAGAGKKTSCTSSCAPTS